MINKTGKIGVFFLLLLTATFFHYFTLKKGHDWGDDFALYIAQATALNNDQVHELQEYQSFAQENNEIVNGPTFYPWGYPTILALTIKLAGLDLEIFKLLNIGFVILGLVCMLLLFRNKLSFRQLLLFTGFWAFNYFLSDFKNEVVSDLLFLVFSLITIWSIEKAIEQGEALYFILCGFIAISTIEIRSIGIVLIPTFLIYLFQLPDTDRESKINAASFFVLPILIFGIFIALLLPFSSYLTHFKWVSLNAEFHLIYDNLIYYSKLPADLFLPNKWKWLFYIIFIPLMAYGIIKEHRKYRLYILYLLLYILVLLIFPYQKSGLRYLLPVLPFMVFFFMTGSQLFMERFIPKLKGFEIGFLIVLLTINLFEVQRRFEKEYRIGPYSDEALEMMEYVLFNTEKDAIVAFNKPKALSLYTGRRSYIAKAPTHILKMKGAYIVLNKFEDVNQITYEEIFKLQRQKKIAFAYGNSAFEIFQVK